MTFPMPHAYSGHRLERIARIGTRWSGPAGTVTSGPPCHYNELGFRGPGNYLSLPKLLISWLLFALWIWAVGSNLKGNICPD